MATKLRKCTYKKEENQDGRVVISEQLDGLFHCWGEGFRSQGDEVFTFTVAIVESKHTGQVYGILPSYICFTEQHHE